METKTKYSIHQLTEESVIIETLVTGEWNGKEIKLENDRTDYPNVDWGLEAFYKAIDDERILTVVEIMFGIKQVKREESA